ncbi:protein odr-4 homolog isoform X2 [Varanus komodoensis]|uniref:protein odr-4 homolog isoform X2 n=1 Tax=Varanus komodoensis TaxID=61221 RepID=UPI001CF77AB1|nr:protein odr-4 homolog isoform X2 [Varanus komodoensis]
MGRSYIVDEAVGPYLSELASCKSKAFVTGLLIGQCSQQKDYVLIAVRTPPKEEKSESNTSYHSDLSHIDEEWITAHATQVSRMLPGGLLVLGVFVIAVPELAKEIQNTLRKLVFSVEKSLAKKRLWNISEEDVSDRVTLHLCSTTKKLCRTYNMQDPKSPAKPADWKYQNGLSSSWLSLDCTINANIHIPLPVTLANHDLEKNTRVGLVRWAKQIEEAVFLINGQVKEEDTDLLEGQKKFARGNMSSSSQSLDVRVLMQLSRNSSSRSTATVQVCSGSINLKGALKCKAYIHNNKPKVKDAVKALKRDIINTLSDRCEILFEDLIINETLGEKNSEREYHTLPCRVFAPIAGSTVLFCDYKFGDESAEEIQDRFLEMLDQAVQAEDLHAAEEMHIVEVSPPKELQDNVQQKRLTKEMLLLKLHQNIGMVVAVAVAVSAAAFSFNYFSD